MYLVLFIALFGNSVLAGVFECPPCPKNDGPCHDHMVVFEDKCQCEICLTKCFERLNYCGAGYACQLEPVFFDDEEIGESAVCVEFKACPVVNCDRVCPASGFFRDANGCRTCLCNNPCKELNCSEKDCITEWTTPESEPTYECLETRPHYSPKKFACPKCPEDAETCDRIVNVEFGSRCSCSFCVANCSERDSPCQKGEVCNMKPILYGGVKVSETALCTQFFHCANITCLVDCPESGYFFDKNDCATCLCNDPCKELNCPSGECLTWSSDPAMEPDYECKEN